MGWTIVRTATSAKEFLDLEFTFETEDRRCTVLDSEFGDDGVYYAAIQMTWTGSDAREVSGLVCLVERHNDPSLGYKPISEAMGPRYFACPSRILDLLTPTCQPFAIAWRWNCRHRTAAHSVATAQ